MLSLISFASTNRFAEKGHINNDFKFNLIERLNKLEFAMNQQDQRIKELETTVVTQNSSRHDMESSHQMDSKKKGTGP